MTKYSLDFKMKVIHGYLAGMGSTSLCHKFHIPSKRSVLNWVHRYQVKGFAGLKNCDKWPKYTCDFKLDVLKWMKENHSTLESTALHFKISSPSTIYQWDRRFETVGVDGLKIKRGRPPMGKKKNPDRTAKKNDKLKIASQSDQERLKDLEKENKLLRIENEYLKKLDALVRQREQHERNKRK
ncbi:helix-turn-helix domain-containing protein [Sporolactobacillus putidus]|uniref:Transposase n=1 Tax=Sporolactobacillus putidus TaxID=492735 RepID=A0A917W553_9BACL|nr:helix-turn-helix domain-containing protein [Sporolactobacillus putidus]GGL64559.1 transposase [Sporolactobacillus putidus]